MASRHGNKGVILQSTQSKICLTMKTVRRVNIVLNPLGIPSRIEHRSDHETHWVWLRKVSATRINAMLKQQQEVAKLREFIQRAYNVALTLVRKLT
ncbi:hypothetical protein ACLK1T_10495 [Escherichia coli]